MATNKTKKTTTADAATKKVTPAKKTTTTKATPTAKATPTTKVTPTKQTATTTTSRKTAPIKVEAPMILRARPQPSYEDVARRAYELFEARGYTHGCHLDDWVQAEQELGARQ